MSLNHRRRKSGSKALVCHEKINCRLLYRTFLGLVIEMSLIFRGQYRMTSLVAYLLCGRNFTSYTACIVNKVYFNNKSEQNYHYVSLLKMTKRSGLL